MAQNLKLICLLAFYLGCYVSNYIQICVINITNNTKQCIYISQTNLLFYLNFWPLVREKRANQRSTSLPYQGQASSTRKISITFAITNHEQSLTMGFPLSCTHRSLSTITPRPTSDTKPYRTPLPTHPTPSPSKIWWDSFQRPHNCRIPSPMSSLVTHWNRMCSHHRPQGSF